MSHQNHYTLEFKGRVLSDHRTRKISFNTSTKFDIGNAVACLRSFDDGKETLGYIKFSASQTDGDQQADLHLKNFLAAMQLAGLEFEPLAEPALRWIMPDGKGMKQLEFEFTSAYAIDVITTSISKNKISNIETLFNDLQTDTILQQLASDLAKKEKIPAPTAEFLFYWISFNKIYNSLSQGTERKNIEMYIDRLNTHETAALYQKHSQLFTELSKLYITDLQGNNLSQSLQQVLRSRNQKEIIKKATLCVYGLRNSFVHEGHLCGFQNISVASIFVRNVIYATLLPKYDL